MLARQLLRLALAGAVLLGWSATAVAAPSWLELRWPEQPGCPTPQDVEAAILRLTAGTEPHSVTAEATMTADAAGYTLNLAVRDGGGQQQRVLQSPRCEVLADATAVIVAVAAEPLAVATRVVVPPAPAPDDELLLPPPAPPAMASLPAPIARRRPRIGLSFGTAAGVGPSPRFVPGVAGTVSLLWPRVRLDVRGSYWFKSTTRYSDRPDVGADLQLAAGAVRGCPRLMRGSLSLQLCGGLELGALLARGFGLERIQHTRGVWAAGLLAPGVQWQPLRWLALGVEIEGVLAITRRTYTARDAVNPLYEVPPVGLRLGGGLTVIFP